MLIISTAQCLVLEPEQNNLENDMNKQANKRVMWIMDNQRYGCHIPAAGKKTLSLTTYVEGLHNFTWARKMVDNEVVVEWCGEQYLVIVDYISEDEIEWHTSDPDFDRAVMLSYDTRVFFENEIEKLYLEQNQRNFEEYQAGV